MMSSDKVFHESIDDLLVPGLKIIQSRNGYRFSIDPILLCGFAEFPKHARVVDLGTGNGVIPILLAAHKKAESIIGVEVQQGMADRARRSIQLNRLEAVVRIIEADIRELSQQLEPGRFDVVTANPPYRKPGSGRTALGDERCLARHELTGGLSDFLLAANSLLKLGGRCYIVYLAERLAELLAELHRCDLEPKRLRMVHSRSHEKAKLVLVEGRRGAKPGLVVEAPLVVYDGPGRRYTSEALKIYGLDQ
jgi:tRNA1Val (adenine37-N6)-methyltransferase